MLKDLRKKLTGILEKGPMGLYNEKVFQALVGLFIALLVMEVSLRLFPAQLSKARLLSAVYCNYRFEPDPFLVRKLKPNLDFNIVGKEFSYPLHTVSLGYEGIGFRDDGINSECFAIALGDSFTEGVIDSENLWVELLEKKTGLDFVNMGEARYSPIQEVRMLQKYGAPLKPKLVLWAFYQNDFSDSYDTNKRLREWMEGKPIHSGSENWLIQHSWVCRVFNYIRTYRRAKSEERGDNSQLSPYPYKDGRLSLVFYPSFLERNIDRLVMQEGCKLTKESLLEAKAICQNIKATLVVILIPCKEQSYWHIVKGLIKDSENYDIDQLNTLMNNFCEEQGITCLDLTPIFREHSRKQEQLYYTFDAHWNKEGNHLAAEAILSYLRQEKLLSQ